HTQCGAMQAILDPARLDSLPYVKRWLRATERVREIIDTRYGPFENPEDRVTAAVQENVLVALEHLRAFPFVQERLAAGKRTVSGWVYDIATGKVHAYDPDVGEFQPITG